MRTHARRLLLAILLSAHAAAQSPDRPASLAFEVATIKPSDPAGGRSEYFVVPGGGFRGRNLTLKDLIRRTYQLLSFQLSGGPAWIDSERYDVQANPERSDQNDSVSSDLTKLSAAQWQTFHDLFTERMKALLADRFQLKLRGETKELPVYVLAIGKNGHKLHEILDSDTSSPKGIRVQRGRYIANRMPLANLTSYLGQQLDRSVLDETGLKGNYDFTLQWAPDPAPGSANTAPAESDAPSIFTAIQEQLGLKLESRKGPVEIFVIDHAERSSEN